MIGGDQMSCLFDNVIDYTNYFNKTCILKRYNDSNSPLSPDGEYGDDIEIKCWVGGSEKFYRNTDNQLTVASKTYRTLTPIYAKDLIDGQVVVQASVKYGLDGITVEYYKAFVE